MDLNVFSALSLSLLVLLSSFSSCSKAQLSAPTFYDLTCPSALPIIRNTVGSAVFKEPRMAASLVRLHFHDCFVQGCDASVLLDQTPTIESEKTSLPNNNSIRGFDVIDTAKAEIERICPGVVSCADIVAVAARDAVVAVGGPFWQVNLGRRDSTTASRDLSNSDIPSPFEDFPVLLGKFMAKGLTPLDMVALLGAHTIGQAQCFTFRSRIYNATDIDPGFARIRQQNCPAETTIGDFNLEPLDFVTPTSFDNNYYNNLLQNKALLHSDQQLLTTGETSAIVNLFSRDPGAFASGFVRAIIKMGDISPLTGQNGIIRRVCGAVN